MNSNIKRIIVEVPELEGKVFINEGYVKAFNEHVRDWRVRFTIELLHFYIVRKDEILKVIKLGEEAKRTFLNTIRENYPKDLIKVRETYVGPNEWEKTYYVYIPLKLLEEMVRNNLVLLTVKEYHDYEVSTLTFDIYEPDKIKNTWEKVVNVIL